MPQTRSGDWPQRSLIFQSPRLAMLPGPWGFSLTSPTSPRICSGSVCSASVSKSGTHSHSPSRWLVPSANSVRPATRQRTCSRHSIDSPSSWCLPPIRARQNAAASAPNFAVFAQVWPTSTGPTSCPASGINSSPRWRPNCGCSGRLSFSSPRSPRWLTRSTAGSPSCLGSARSCRRFVERCGGP